MVAIVTELSLVPVSSTGPSLGDEIVFAEKQITAQALITLGSLAPYAGAITGGTGKYEGVKGEVRVRTLTGGTKGILTFDLQH